MLRHEIRHEGRMKGKPTKGRKRVQLLLLDDLADGKDYASLKREAEDRSAWTAESKTVKMVVKDLLSADKQRRRRPRHANKLDRRILTSQWTLSMRFKTFLLATRSGRQPQKWPRWTYTLEPCTGLQITARPVDTGCFLGPSRPVFCLKFRPAKVKARHGPARLACRDGHHGQFFGCYGL